MRDLPEHILCALESGNVPSPPQVLLRLLQLVDDERTTMAELAALVEQDPGLAARILGAANSPLLRRGTELRSLESCLIALGTRLVRTIATCLSIQQLFARDAKLPTAHLSGFWGHSLMVAELSRNLAASVAYPRPEEAYLAGLLHDVGELILISGLGDAYVSVLASTPDEGERVGLEFERFGVHHGVVGTWLVDRWQMDSIFADGILFHHSPSDLILTAAPLPQLVWLAHALVNADDVAALLAELNPAIAGFASAEQLIMLRDQAERRTHMIGEALGLRLPESLVKRHVWAELPATNPPPEVSEPEEALAVAVGGMALLQPLQQDLFALESEAEVLLSLRESARILFGLNRVAFLFCDGASGKLSGKTVGGQPAVFRQFDIPQDETCCLAAAAAVRQEIKCSFDGQSQPKNALIDIQFARAFTTDGLLCVPMVAKSRVVAVMVCGLSAGQYARLLRRLSWLMNFGRIAALSLETLREAKAYRQAAESDASERFVRQARRVIHEARNPLGIIKSYLKILDMKLPEPGTVRQELEVLTEEIDRVATIVGRMSEIPDPATQAGVDLVALIDELLLLYGEALFGAQGIAVHVDLPKGPCPTRCARDGLKQILLNLWKNASEALSAGQEVRIELTDGVLHNGQVYLQLKLTDNGPGISDEAMRAMKTAVAPSASAQRGLGLSIVGDLARQHGLSMTCYSQPGQGTSIALLVPQGGMHGPSAESPAPRPGTGVTNSRHGGEQA